jgi:hypothetical protein
MKLFCLLFFAALLWGCSGNTSSRGGGPEKEVKADIGECMRKTLHYHTVDMHSYDSLATQYFHEIKDYTGSKAKKLYKRILNKKHLVNSDSIRLNNPDEVHLLQYQIDSLQHLISKFEKEVVGYVFVHTFQSEQDTLSMIIVMDNKCDMSEAIPIKAIKDIDPDDYIENVSGE